MPRSARWVGTSAFACALALAGCGWGAPPQEEEPLPIEITVEGPINSDEAYRGSELAGEAAKETATDPLEAEPPPPPSTN